MDYKNGRIYIIRNHINNLVYVGSTTQPLVKRFSIHKTNLHDRRRENFKLYKAMWDLRIDNFYIELVCLFPCESKEQLNAEEGKYIRIFNSYYNGYNSKREGIKTIFCDEIKEEKRLSDMIYREVHSDKVKLHKSKKVQCECGCMVTQSGLARHKRTKKHISQLNS